MRASAQTRSAATGQDTRRALRAPRRSRHAALAGIRSPSDRPTATRMEAREIAILAGLGFADPYAAPRAHPTMSTDSPERETLKPTLLERLSAFLTREPEDREGLLEILHGAFEHKLLDADALSIIEGALQVSEMTVRDIMIPRAQMDVVSIDDDPSQFIPFVLETRHSRFPVIGESKDDVVGILLAKELLNFYANPDVVQSARHAAARSVRAGVEAPERAAARLSRQPQSHRHRRRRVRRRVRTGHDRGRARADRRRHRGRIRLRRGRGQHHSRSQRRATGSRRRPRSPISTKRWAAISAATSSTPWAASFCRPSAGCPSVARQRPSASFRFKVIRADSRRIYTLQVERVAPQPEPGSAFGQA